MLERLDWKAYKKNCRSVPHNLLIDIRGSGLSETVREEGGEGESKEGEGGWDIIREWKDE